MRLAKKEREQVVELLRCAADMVQREHLPFGTACNDLDLSPGCVVIETARDAAIGALNACEGPDWVTCGYLEAALRVEAGEWP